MPWYLQDNPMGEMRRNEAAHAAQMALETEQRRMEWQIRSSFQGVLSGFAPRDTF